MRSHDHGPTLTDSGEVKVERFAFGGLPRAWDDDDDDDEEEKETQMMQVPDRPSQRSLRVLPAVPKVWAPPPRTSLPSRVLPRINPPPHRPVDPFAATFAAHWVPEPPPPRVSLPSADGWTSLRRQPAVLQPFTSLDASDSDLILEHGIGPHAAITMPTPVARAKRQRIARRVVLPWPAMVMVAAVAGGVVFEHVERGDTWSILASTVNSAQRLVRR